MEGYKITSEDIENIETLIRIVNKIYQIYTNLITLEYEENKNSSEYKSLLEKLNELKVLEEVHYEYANLTNEKIAAWTNYIYTFTSIDTTESPLNCILDNNFEHIIYYRILESLKNLALANKDKQTFETIVQSTIKLEEKSLEDLISLIMEQYQSSLEFDYAIEKDAYSAFLRLFYQQSQNDKTLKKDFLQIKYILSFISPIMEEELFENEFSIPNELYISNKLVIDKYNIPEDIYYHEKNNIFLNWALQQIFRLLETKDEEHIKNRLPILLKSLFIRACFLNADKKELEDFNYYYHNLLEKLQTKESRKSEEVISNCFRKINKDRELARYLSFKK